MEETRYKHALTNYKHDGHNISNALTSCINKLLTGLTKLLVLSLSVFCILLGTFSLFEIEAGRGSVERLPAHQVDVLSQCCKNTYSPLTFLPHWTKEAHKNPATNLLLRAVGKAADLRQSLYDPKLFVFARVPQTASRSPACFHAIFHYLPNFFFSIQLSKERLNSHEARPLAIRPAVFGQWEWNQILF